MLVGADFSVALAMYANAVVRAPAISVVVVDCKCDSLVFDMRVRRFVIISVSTVRKGRYLFASSMDVPDALGPSVISTSPSACPFVFARFPEGRGVGYSHVAWCEWLAITATWFAEFMARCAFMKTKRFAIALDSGSVLAR